MFCDRVAAPEPVRHTLCRAPTARSGRSPARDDFKFASLPGFPAWAMRNCVSWHRSPEAAVPPTASEASARSASDKQVWCHVDAVAFFGDISRDNRMLHISLESTCKRGARRKRRKMYRKQTSPVEAARQHGYLSREAGLASPWKGQCLFFVHGYERSAYGCLFRVTAVPDWKSVIAERRGDSSQLGLGSRTSARMRSNTGIKSMKQPNTVGPKWVRPAMRIMPRASSTGSAGR
jgi:hypothetical protein